MLQFTLHSTDQTVGQQLLGIRYGQVRGVDSGQWISGRQKAHLALLYIACPWLRERLAQILRLLHLSSWEQQVSVYLYITCPWLGEWLFEVDRKTDGCVAD